MAPGPISELVLILHGRALAKYLSPPLPAFVAESARCNLKATRCLLVCLFGGQTKTSRNVSRNVQQTENHLCHFECADTQGTSPKPLAHQQNNDCLVSLRELRMYVIVALVLVVPINQSIVVVVGSKLFEDTGRYMYRPIIHRPSPRRWLLARVRTARVLCYTNHLKFMKHYCTQSENSNLAGAECTPSLHACY